MDIETNIGWDMIDFDVMEAMQYVLQARRQSIAKHGSLIGREDILRHAGILCEEAGEVMAEVLKHTKPDSTGSHRGADGTIASIRHELAQTAQHAIAMIINLNREEAGVDAKQA